MRSIESIMKQLNDLPIGYLSKKKIHGRYYYYLQRSEFGKIKSVYIRDSELPEIREKIKLRKQLETELNKRISVSKKLPVPSSRARELTGSIMMSDIEVARFERGMLAKIDETRAPLFIIRTHNVSEYLASRIIDRSRTNARILMKIMEIRDEPDDMVAMYAHGAAITDNYWFKAKGSRLKYADISFENDFYSSVALNGQTLAFAGKKSMLSPELTLTGSYEKCWKLIDGDWWLYKKGNANEIFSEIFCSRLAKAIGIPTADYECDDGDIRTKNFADRYNFEPMTSIAGDDDSYENVFNKLRDLESELAEPYLTLIWFDSIVNNIDRHNENCGIMRDKEDGSIISLAPNFDNNLALISRGTSLNMNPSKDGFIKYFVRFLKTNKDAMSCYKQMRLPIITEEHIDYCLHDLTLPENCHPDISEYILGRYKYLQNLQDS